MEIDVDSINIKLGKQTIKLSLKEAKKLKEVLDSIFEKEIVFKDRFTHVYPWLSPLINDVSPLIPDKAYEITCTDRSLFVDTTV